ncbi:MAG TPA: DUF445 domain-containing protein, partial [Burkholderiales bacterium]|nr:DUF445 domain-containing protein [Burkholderiales bacterium]
RMKWLATGLLVLAAAAYVVSHQLELQYVAAFSEAAMIGALADWFAVVALFRRPLNLPIPHTAIIPRNKERIARGLSEFIQHNFLSAAALVQRIAEFRPAHTLCRWLLQPANADTVATYASRFLAYALGAVDDARVQRFLQRSVSAGMRKIDLAGAAAQLLDILTENKRHHALLDAALNGLDDLLAKEDTRRFIAAEVAKSAPLLKKLSDWLQLNLDERAALKIVELAIAKVHEVRATRDHELRAKFDQFVAGFVQRLKTDEALRAKIREMRDEALASPALATYIDGLWKQLRAWLSADLEARPSVTRERIAAMVRAFGERLEADREIRQWIDEQILVAVPPLVEEHRAGIGRFIEDQINGWQEKKLVQELERHIGPDLQYIRINGTLVGGLAGLAIAALTALIS